MKLFVTGISTNVGKTVVSAILTEALEADYWKPVQAGELHNTDSDTVRRLISNRKSIIHPESYRLESAKSPHASADDQSIEINLSEIIEPSCKKHLIIEGAGGLLVPLNRSRTIADIIKDDYHVVIVSSHYLGSINHTLLTVEALRSRNRLIAGIIFSGDEQPQTESIIREITGCTILGRIGREPYVDKNVVLEYASLLRPHLKFS